MIGRVWRKGKGEFSLRVVSFFGTGGIGTGEGGLAFQCMRRWVRFALVHLAGLAAGLGAVPSCDGGLASPPSETTGSNLKVSLLASSPEVAPGETFEVTLLAENLSRDRTLRNVEVLVPLSGALDPVRWLSDVWRRQELKDAPTNMFAWTLDELAPGERSAHTILLRSKVERDFVAYNAALAFSQDERGTLLDNGSMSAMPVRLPGGGASAAAASLRLRAAGPGEPVAPGEPFSVRMHLENLSGEAIAHDVLLIGCIDAHLELAGDRSNEHRDPNAKRFFTWRTPQIRPGGQAVVQMRMRTKDGTDLTDVSSVFTIAFLTGVEGDPDLSDNWLLLSTPLLVR